MLRQTQKKKYDMPQCQKSVETMEWSEADLNSSDIFIINPEGKQGQQKLINWLFRRRQSIFEHYLIRPILLLFQINSPYEIKFHLKLLIFTHKIC